MPAFSGTLAGRLRPNTPKLQVFGAIIVSYAIKVMNSLVPQQIATEHLFHHDSVLQHILAPGPATSYRMVVRRIQEDIPPAFDPATLPLMAVLATLMHRPLLRVPAFEPTLEVAAPGAMDLDFPGIGICDKVGSAPMADANLRTLSVA